MYLRYFIIHLVSLSYINCFQNVTPKELQNEKQSVALVRLEPTEGANRNLYRMAKPKAEENVLKLTDFGFHTIDGHIYHACPMGCDNKIDITMTTQATRYTDILCSAVAYPALGHGFTGDGDLSQLWHGSKTKKIYQIGYKVDVEDTNSNKCGQFTRKQFDMAPVLGLVFDSKNHIINLIKYYIASAKSLDLETSFRTDFDPSELIYGKVRKIDDLYNIDQRAKCKEMFSHTSQDQCDHLAFKLGLLKKQLAPKDDFLFPTWKRASFFNAATAPMWRILSFKWGLVEHFIRRLANEVEDLEVYSGTAGIMKYSFKDHKDTNMYLGPIKNKTKFKIPIPAYFWKAIQYNQQIGILIIMHNNPFVDNITRICQERDFCFTNGWLLYNNNFENGLIYCCELSKENMNKLLGEEFNAESLNLNNLQSELSKEMLTKILAP